MTAGRAGWLAATFVLCGCGRYADFTLPVERGGAQANVAWKARPEPVINRGAPDQWDSHDVLNPAVIRFQNTLWNFYSGFDGHTWHTGAAVSADGLTWQKRGRVLSPDPATWEGDYIAANGAVTQRGGELLYFYQGGRKPRIGLARSSDGVHWTKRGDPVLGTGPRGSWDELAAADPNVIEAGGQLYMFYLGMDRARRQRLGVARSSDGVVWEKLRTNPVLELGEYGSFDENGLGEPAVWASESFYWMLYTGRDRNENRRLGLARSQDGVHWIKLPLVFDGGAAWDSRVVCDPTVIVDADQVRVWFGGGDRPRPDENVDGQIGYATLRFVR